MKSVSELNCPRCGRMMTKAFANASANIPYEKPESILKFIHASGSVQHLPYWKGILPHAAEFFLSYLCEDCRIYMIDFSSTLSSSEAKKLAEEYLQNHG